MKVITTVILLVISNSVWSQSITDALLLAQEDITGTSRYTGMAGAFGALGGDLSAITDNPAGAGTIFPSWESVVQLPIIRPRQPIFQERRHKNLMNFKLINLELF